MMTFQTLVIDPFRGMLDQVIAFIPTLVTLFLILIIGLLFTKLVHYVVVRLFKELKIDRLADTIKLSDALKKGGISSFSDMVGSLVNVSFTIIFALVAFKAVGVVGVSDSLDRIMGYVPHVITAVLILTLGHILATFVSKLIHVVAAMMDLPKPKLLERISRWAIVIYAITLMIDELGYGSLLVGTPFHILLGGLALGLGLGIKDHVHWFFVKDRPVPSSPKRSDVYAHK